MKIRFQVPLEHGVLFLHDTYGDFDISDDTGAASVTFTESCIAFHVEDYLDGEADVTLSDHQFSTSVPAVFSRKMNYPSKYISMTDTPANYYCILKLKSDYAEINIWDYEDNAHKMSWIQIKGIDIF